MTQAETIRWHMANVGPITSDEAWRLYRITRLAARIGDLKRKGYTVHVETLSVDTQYGNTQIARYSLPRTGQLELAMERSFENSQP